GVPQPLTVVKICAALGMHVATAAQPEAPEGEAVALHTHADDKVFDLDDLAAGPLDGKKLPGGLKASMLMLQNHLETGQIYTRMLELYAETERRSHQGEEMVYVLRGTALVSVGSKSYKLSEGESVTFW